MVWSPLIHFLSLNPWGCLSWNNVRSIFPLGFHMWTGLMFASYGPSNVTTWNAQSSPIRAPMSTGPPEAPFSSYGPENVTDVTAWTSPIRIPYVKGPPGSSVFEQRAHEYHVLDRPVQPHQGSLCQRARRSLRFRVTGPQTSPKGRPGPAPLGSPCQKAWWRLRFCVTSPRTSPTGPPCPTQSGSPMSMGLREALFSSYGPTIVTTGTAQSSRIRVPDVIGPDRGSVFELRAHEHHHQDRPVQPQQGPHVNGPGKGSVFELRARERHHQDHPV